MIVKLFQPIVIATGLDEGEAINLLRIIAQHPSTEHVNYYISGGPNQNGCSLVGSVRILDKMFLEDPESFYIELDND